MHTAGISRLLLRAATLLLVCRVLPGTDAVRAQTWNEDKVVKVKAAYLYSFSKFVTWPEAKFSHGDAPIVLGLLGRDAAEMKQLLDGVAGSRGLIQNRRLEIRLLAYVPERPADAAARAQFVDAARGCHLLFMDDADTRAREDIFGIIEAYQVLSVGEGDGFAHNGGMVALVHRGESIVFQVNIASTNREQLVISPKLLRNAQVLR